MLRIVVNPGHEAPGGDPGAVGPDGLHEADVVRRVAAALAAKSDAAIQYEPKRQDIGGLAEFLHALRANPPDAVLSLHLNSGSPTRRDGEVYYYRADHDTQRATRACRFAGHVANALTHWGVVPTAKVLSAPYARGDDASFTPGILVGTSRLASVLAELDFVSNLGEDKRMESEAWVEKAASALDYGVREWAKEL